jgi:hypothetical protein
MTASSSNVTLRSGVGRPLTYEELDTNFQELINIIVESQADVVKHNISAIVDPTVNDDSSQGYEPRSTWFNTATGEIFKCIDATVGAAKWVLISLTLDDLGTASTADLTTSATDTTAGRVLKVGDFGVGSTPNVAWNIDDFTLPPGDYYFTDGSTGTKPSGEFSGHVHISREGDGLTVSQTWRANTSNRVWQRQGGTYSNSWSPWVEIFHTGNTGSILGGDGLTGGGDLTSTRTISLGTPGTINGGTVNSATATSHTHAVSSTASRSDASTSTLLQAKAMNDHIISSDHDARYALSSEVSSINSQVQALDSQVEGFGSIAPMITTSYIPPGSRGAFEGTESTAVAAGFPSLGGSSEPRHWSIDSLGTENPANRYVQIAVEVFGIGTTRGRTFIRVKHDETWHPWTEIGGGGGGASAWVNFNGMGTVAIRAALNVSSITDNNQGQYTVNFATAMPDTNYTPILSTSKANFTLYVPFTPGNVPLLLTQSQVMVYNSDNGAFGDANLLSVAIFR